MAARTKARRRALDVLFEADQKGRGDTADDLLALLEERKQITVAQGPFPPYAAEIVTGVAAHGGEIDELLRTYSQGWSLERMAAVDRAILRLGAWELLYNDDVPDAVAVDEAVNLATELSTDESPSFVNGLLARLMEIKPTL
ncbi:MULTISPECIES: transcription antitermination factor NusB [Georgenia]|uniref:Transcription antitermination protein NusB n=1 Tax=Georgenia muralis TaxID=154117 RepID=A0A3N5AA23_9MICO|nr:transcription antitermination factor NusB [Georgenia muralis]RPF28471.1 NusB antitermination factor [Georgenia muralis]